MTARKRRILLVDDEAEILEILQHFLADSSIEIVTASNGKEALERHQASPFDVIVSDLRMPLMGGVELLKKLRDSFDDTPFIILTGHGDLSSAMLAVQLGAYQFCTKPFDPTEIKEAVAEALVMSDFVEAAQEDVEKFIEKKMQMGETPDPKLVYAAQKLFTAKRLRTHYAHQKSPKIP